MSSLEDFLLGLSVRDDVSDGASADSPGTPSTTVSRDGLTNDEDIHPIALPGPITSPDNSPWSSPPTVFTESSASSSMSTAGPTVSARLNANISVREYIYFMGSYPLPAGTPIPYTPQLHISNPLKIPYGPSEPTSTLVLTSPRSTFVDLRILKPFSASEPALPNTGGPASRVEWAFAGTSFSDTIPGREDEDVTHSIWYHQVDTKYTLDQEIPVDEGDMYAFGDGRALEFGHSWNAEIGYEQAYEELWDDIDVKATFPSTTTKVCVVMRLEMPDRKARGVIIRLGQFCQGILRQGTQWVVERWQFKETVEGKGTAERKVVGGQWERTVRVGDLFLPCAVAFQKEGLALGTTVHMEGGEWYVEEYAEWEEDDNGEEGGG